MRRGKRAIGYALVTLGILIALFSWNIVFPGLELLLGPETIVGKRNVYYVSPGEYYMTNPEAMYRWQAYVVLSGASIAIVGGMLIWDPWNRPKTHKDR